MPGELGVAVTTVVALAAGAVRGFTGFGGPAFMLAILAIFYAPLAILGKIFVVDIGAGAYLFLRNVRDADWSSTAYLTVPTILMLPAGQWMLIHGDPVWLRYGIAAIIAGCSLLMLAGLRYTTRLAPVALMTVGAISGMVFGATYIALIVVAAILLGPYPRTPARALIICWAFFTGAAYGVLSGMLGTTTLDDVRIALPAAAAYLFGAWLGAKWFRESSEAVYRKIALLILLILSCITLAS